MPKIEKVCARCEKHFEVWPVRAETAVYCSRACRDAENAARYEAARPKRKCMICGTLFECPPSHALRRKDCCSRACAAEASKRREVATGADHFNWKSGSAVHADGYIYLHAGDHPFAKCGRYVFEHRLVMEAWMRDEAPDHHFLVEVAGVKYLRPEIEVHHRNENKRDNRITNLLACTKGAHLSIHNGNPPMEGEVWPPIEGMVPYQPYRVTCTCRKCGKEFTEKRSTVARGGGKYCCRACYDARSREAFHVVPL